MDIFNSTMKKVSFSAISLVLLSFSAVSQIYIEPILGYQKDLNNRNFHQLNTGIQSAFKLSKSYELIFQVLKSWPNSSSGKDSSFSLNPNLPLSAPAGKTFRPSTFAITIGNRIRLWDNSTGNMLNLLLNLGFCDQSIEVKYNYDKSNYTILNPDQSLDRTGVFLGGGLEYMRILKSGRIFIQLTFSTPPVADKINYSNSYNLLAPMAINVGYSFKLPKKKNGK
jgi:hypothetical protein